MPSDDAEIESRVLQWYHRSQSGRDTPPEDFCRDRPDLLERFLEQVERVLRMKAFIGALGAGETNAAVPAPAAHAPEFPRLTGFAFRALLGRGGMGAVYAAEEPDGREVAVKVLRPDRADLPAARARFLREGRAGATVAHDNLMPVLRVGEENGVAYIVMPRLPGETLADWLAGGPMSVPELLQLGRHVARGLAAAHAASLVHRDLKPSNVWLEQLDGGSWRARLMDFGLALDLHESVRLTATGLPLGTVGYMSPEQAEGVRSVDSRCDLFALGVLLYEGATGAPPFGLGGNPVPILNAIASSPAPDEPLRAALPPSFVAIIMRLLAKDPAARPQTAAEVDSELRALEAEIGS